MSKIPANILINLIKNSIDSFKAEFMSKYFFRQEIYLATILIIIAFLISETATEKILLISSILIMIIVDHLNNLIKLAADQISFENLHTVSRLKNISNALVFFAIINLISTWLFVLFF